MQRPSPRFRLEKYLVYEISGEMFYQICMFSAALLNTSLK